MMRNVFLTFTFILTGFFSRAQDAFPLQYSFRNGTYLYFSDKAISTRSPMEGITSVRVSRDNGRGFKELITITQAGSAAAFRKLVGEEGWAQLKTIKKAKTDEELWQYIVQHPNLNDYGLLAFNLSFRQAMGSAFLDRETAQLAPGKNVNYRIEFLDAGGKVLKTSTGSISGGEKTFALSNVKMNRLFANDSVVFMSWSARYAGQLNGLITADVYRQVGGKGVFRKIGNPVLANIRNDSVVFYYDENVVPGALYRYYIRPKDAMGNMALPSDTISALSVNFAALPLLQTLSVRDTLNSLVLKWQPLGQVPQIVGIEIQRSRDARGDYVVLDTIGTNQTTYTDDRVLPNIAYFYRLRVIGLKGMERETGYSGYATGSVKNELKKPDPPYALQATFSNGFIKLNWQPVSDPDIYGYFVYRATNEQGKFQVISSGLSTTEFIDSTRISGRTQYVYAVKAVSNNSLESEFSNKISIRQPFAQLPAAPGGLNAYMDSRNVALSWPSVAKLDHAIAGYNVYRRKLLPDKNFDTKLSAAAQADKLKFILLNREIITSVNFSDVTAEPGSTYEYAISSVDVFGMESTFSPYISVNTTVAARVIFNCSIRKLSKGVALEWDPALNNGTDAISINRKKAGDANYQKIVTLKKGETIYTDITAQRGILYIYEIRGEKDNRLVTRSEQMNIKL